MCPAIVSGILRSRRSAIGQLFPLSQVLVPEVFANVYSDQFPSRVSKLANGRRTSTFSVIIYVYSIHMQVNLVVLVMAIRIVVRRARYKAKPNEKNIASSFQLEIR